MAENEIAKTTIGEALESTALTGENESIIEQAVDDAFESICGALKRELQNYVARNPNPNDQEAFANILYARTHAITTLMIAAIWKQPLSALRDPEINSSDFIAEVKKTAQDLLKNAIANRSEHPDTAISDELAEKINSNTPQIVADADDIIKAIQRSLWPIIQGGRITYNNTAQVKTVTDKLMNVFFAIDAPARNEIVDGQRELIHLKYEKRGQKKEITLLYDYEYDEKALEQYGIPQGFNGYDFFVATILDNLKDEGNRVVSLSKILAEMGMEGSPAQQQITKLTKALYKGQSTMIHIDDAEVQQAWGSDHYHEMRTPVFPIKITDTRYFVNGNVTDGSIIIYDYTPFYTLAATLGHVTTWDKRILQLYTGRKTTRYWNLMQMCVREIGWMRNNHSTRSNKILYSRMYARVGDDCAQDRKLTRDMFFRLMDEVFKPTGYVISYKEDSTTEPGVILEVKKNNR